MNRAFRWISTVSAMAVTIVMASCDTAGDLTQPELSPSPIVVTSTSGKRYVVAREEKADAESVSAQIGRKGGVLSLGRHTLYVSENAVSQTTKFTMTRNAEDALRVRLTAGRNSENDVGAAGFNAPVYLVMSFAKASDVPADKSQIKIVYYRPDGLVEEMTTNLRVWGNYAGADLPHFSLFGLAWP